MSDVEINDSNFKEYFLDVRYNKPRAGMVMARFAAMAVFGDGREKKDVIMVLQKGKAEAAANVMKKIHCAAEPDCYRVCREMCEDLMAGMTEDQVSKKEYEFLFESFYYVKKEHVPRNNPHWHTIDLFSMREQPDGSYKCEIGV